MISTGIAIYINPPITNPIMIIGRNTRYITILKMLQVALNAKLTIFPKTAKNKIINSSDNITLTFLSRKNTMSSVA